jgi:hypothetical protein
VEEAAPAAEETPVEEAAPVAEETPGADAADEKNTAAAET